MKWGKVKVTADRDQRLARINDHDLYTLAETEIMNAGHSLSMFRQGRSEDHLDTALGHLAISTTACLEIKDRGL